ncbi:FXYD domain-containing ion transport regulator 6-like isoform X1 [Takifugu rubripes]|nr:FXYD domain-containing ion transport regulator 6-like isoform X1 [Takifugu rubripes]XP_029695028.1 FXYD domain-containing ion transport regulator 6-like isoform X1 [Takifugu rubripes]XP_029695029.1 FXYD domain-containing ion transport regulator 6-like isoform X1 [Takifugu rubripes]
MMDLVVLVAFSCWLAPALGSAFGREVSAASADDKDYDSDFHYDYESLRIGGLIFAVVLFLMGIALIVTRKCNCSKNNKSNPRGPDAAQRV